MPIVNPFESNKIVNPFESTGIVNPFKTKKPKVPEDLQAFAQSYLNTDFPHQATRKMKPVLDKGKVRLEEDIVEPPLLVKM